MKKTYESIKDLQSRQREQQAIARLQLAKQAYTPRYNHGDRLKALLDQLPKPQRQPEPEPQPTKLKPIAPSKRKLPPKAIKPIERAIAPEKPSKPVAPPKDTRPRRDRTESIALFWEALEEYRASDETKTKARFLKDAGLAKTFFDEAKNREFNAAFRQVQETKDSRELQYFRDQFESGVQGRIYAWLQSVDRPATAPEIAEAIGLRLRQVKRAATLLRRSGRIQSAYIPGHSTKGDARVRYEVSK